MTNKLLAILTVTGLFLMASALVSAHHSGSNYDEAHTITVKGTVTEFEWTNPHALIHLDVVGENGSVQKWVSQETSLNMLHREGWDKNTLKPGDSITLVGNRIKNGANYMIGRKIILSNGKEYTYDGK